MQYRVFFFSFLELFEVSFLELFDVQSSCSNFYLKLLWTSEFSPDFLVIGSVSGIQQLGNSIFKNEIEKHFMQKKRKIFSTTKEGFISINTGLFPIQFKISVMWDASLYSR